MKRRHTPLHRGPAGSPARQAAGHPQTVLTRKLIMQVRQIVAAALLAVTAVGAMSQELDPSETLQARNIGAAQAPPASRTRNSVVAETRNLKAEGQLAAI